jgi:hypothetical protein
MTQSDVCGQAKSKAQTEERRDATKRSLFQNPALATLLYLSAYSPAQEILALGLQNLVSFVQADNLSGISWGEG